MVSSHIRPDNSMKKLIDEIRARAIMAGRKPPSIEKITRSIIKRIDRGELLDEFIRF